MKDKIFNKNKMKVSDFKFNKKVAFVFDDMISRSVPLYKESQEASIRLAREYIKRDTCILDLGCSTGSTLFALHDNINYSLKSKLKYIGLDSSLPMIEQANKKKNKYKNHKKFRFINDDLLNIKPIKNSSVCFMNYTLQFIRPLDRQNIINWVYKSLNKNGIFILMEKVINTDAEFNRLFIDVYHKYKNEMGYSDVEIQKKREALENILIPYQIEENLMLLKSCGFKKSEVFFKWLNWTGIIAIK